MKDKEEKGQDQLDENNYDDYPPSEFIDRVNRDSKYIPQSEDDKKNKKRSDENLEKFKRGELGAEYFRYNDDGSGGGSSRKLDIDTGADPK